MNKEIKEDKKKEGLRGKLQPLVEDFTKKLLEELQMVKIVETSLDTNPKFKINYDYLSSGNEAKTGDDVKASLDTSMSITTAPPEGLPRQRNVIENLTELRNMTNNIYYDLFPVSQNSRPSYSNMLYKLRDNKIIELNWKREAEILEIIDKIDNIGNVVDVQNTAQKILEANRINFNILETEMLKNYAQERLIRFFTDKGYNLEIQSRAQKDNGVDIILKNSDLNRPKLLFEIQFRRANPIPDRSIILQSLEFLREHSKLHPKTYLFQVVYTYNNPGEFDRFRFMYNKILQEIPGFEGYKNKCRFIPVSLTNLKQLEEALHEFSRAFLHQSFEMRFMQQEAPQGFPDRNDHILEQNFQFKQSDFTISIRPNDTKFWRLGFIFSKTDSFPRISENRHGDSNFVMVHLNVGDQQNSEWVEPDVLKLNIYPKEFLRKDELTNWNSYKGTEVIFSMRPTDDGTEVIFSVTVQSHDLGKIVVDLHEFEYCRISAWCDRRPFDLDTTIDIRHK